MLYNQQTKLPLILGRGCSGEVVAVGNKVSAYLPRDLVIAAVPPNCLRKTGRNSDTQYCLK